MLHTHLGLILAFMRISSLYYLMLLPGPNSKKASLSWVRRLKIAVDAAKGTLPFLLSTFKTV
jgi:hypothetical protein